MNVTKIIVGVLVVGFIVGVVWLGSKAAKPSIELTDASTEVAVTTSTPTETSTSTASTTTSNTPTKKTMTTATIATNKGVITLELLNDAVPNTVANFTKLAGEGFYNGTRFHRVIKGFMIQGGDPLSKDLDKAAYWGTGGPGYKFNDELTPTNRNDIGTISMANSGPNTNGSQFFINTAANNFLDPKHVVFGRVTSGMEVVTAIENTKTVDPGRNDRPIEDMIIQSITIK